MTTPIIQKQKSVLVQQLDKDLVLFDMKSENYFTLDEVSHRFWELLSEASNLEHILTTLESEYDVDRALLTKDVHAFIDKLVKHNLIEQPNTGV